MSKFYYVQNIVQGRSKSRNVVAAS